MKEPKEPTRYCFGCGRDDWVREFTRFDAKTCSGACRIRVMRDIEQGHPLAYIDAMDDWTEAQKRARRSLHQAIDDMIAIEKMVRAARRERRRAATRAGKGGRPLHLKPAPDPAPEEPPKHRGGGFIPV
jgi:hypothetical protein